MENYSPQLLMEAYHSVYEAPQQEVEAYEAIVDYLASEGLVESYEEADELIEGMSDDEIMSILDEDEDWRRRNFVPMDPYKKELVQARHAELANKTFKSLKDLKKLNKQPFKKFRPGLRQKIANTAKAGKTAGRLALRAGEGLNRQYDHTEREIGAIKGILKSLEDDQSGNNIRKFTREEYDNYDLILSHLLDEGYADSEDAALQIMSNMSEEWLDQIVEKADNTIRLVYGKGGKGIPLNGHSGYFLRRPNVGFAQQGMNFRNATKDAHKRASASEREREEKNKANAARYDQALRSDIQRATNRSGDDKGLPSGRLRIDRRARNR